MQFKRTNVQAAFPQSPSLSTEPR